jgi:opacity protein-like surface antigen
MRSKLVLSGILLLSSLGVYAKSGLYANIGLGAVFPSGTSSFTSDSTTFPYSPTIPGDSLFQLPNVYWHNSYRTGIDVSAAVGKKIKRHFRGDIEFLYQNIKRNIGGNYGWREVDDSTGQTFSENFQNPSTETSSRLRAYSLLVNGYYDFNAFHHWSPMLGAGIGFAVVNSHGTVANNTLTINDPAIPLNSTAPMLQYSPSIHRTVFAAQLKAGFNYAWNSYTYITFQYRLFATSKLRAGSSKMLSNPGTTDQGEFNIGSHSISGLITNAIELLLRFDF